MIKITIENGEYSQKIEIGDDGEVECINEADELNPDVFDETIWQKITRGYVPKKPEKDGKKSKTLLTGIVPCDRKAGEFFLWSHNWRGRIEDVPQYIAGEDLKVGQIFKIGEDSKAYVYDANKPKERTPDDGEIYYYVSGRGEVHVNKSEGRGIDEEFFTQNNFFSTEKEAKMHALRIEGMSVKNTAKKGDSFYVYDFAEKEIKYWQPCMKSKWDAYPLQPKSFSLREIKNWRDKYAEAFEFFNK